MEEAPPSVPKVLGKVKNYPLDKVTPNEWNPNRMTDHLFRSVVHGLRTDGWVASQALLVWASDEFGESRNVIIDGEHRWRAAQEAGFTEGPMVMLHKLPEREAKALTVKLNQKRGEWDDALLAGLLRELQESAPPDLDMALDLGIERQVMEALAAVEAEASAGQPEATARPEPTPPEEFPDMAAPGAIKTTHRCPKCSYEWSGGAK